MPTRYEKKKVRRVEMKIIDPFNAHFPEECDGNGRVKGLVISLPLFILSYNSTGTNKADGQL